MSVYKWMLAVPLLGVLMFVGMLLRSRANPRPETDTRDPRLRKLQAANPELRIADEFSRLQVYWIKGVPGAERVLFPISEAAGARIQIRPCDLAAIPPAVLYPRRREMVCLEVDNDVHKLQAYFFRSRDSLEKVVGYFEAPLDNSRQFGTGRSHFSDRRETIKREDGANEFQFSYFLYETVDVVGLVGYREELKEKKSAPEAEN